MRATVDRLIARMTIEEKAGQLSILGDDYGKVDDLARRGLLGGTNGVMPGHDVAVYTPHIQDMAMQTLLKIPVWVMGVVAHAYRIVIQVPLARGATRDHTLVERVPRAAAIAANSAG